MLPDAPRRRGRRGARGADRHAGGARPARGRGRLATRGDLPSVRGELVGARLANLLPGVWSTRMPIKLAQPALRDPARRPGPSRGRRSRAPSARPTSARRCASPGARCCAARRTTRSAAARSTRSRGDVATRLATRAPRASRARPRARLLERLAGLGVERRTPWTDRAGDRGLQPVAAPAHRRRARAARSPTRRCSCRVGAASSRRCTRAPPTEGPGSPSTDNRRAWCARTIPTRPRWLPSRRRSTSSSSPPTCPAFGCRRSTLTPARVADEDIDDGREIAARDVRVRVADDGTLDVASATPEYRGLLARRGSRRSRRHVRLRSPSTTIRVDPSRVVRGAALAPPAGIARLEIARVFGARGLDTSRRERRAERASRSRVTTEARVAPGVPRVDLSVRVDNTARDHRLRLLFPTGRPATTFHAATTFDVARARDGASGRPRLGAPRARPPSRIRAG